MPSSPDTSPERGSAAGVFWIFLRLGLTSFGGPVAHLSYFRTEFVARRRWLTDRAYADLVALCQFLPGPASSQVGMAIGLGRAGVLGLIAAWVAFTLPSAVLLVGFAYGVQAFYGIGQGWLAGLKAAAAAVVAHAVIGMARNLTPDLRRALIAIAAAVVVLLLPHPLIQVGVIAAGGFIGLAWLGHLEKPDDDAAAQQQAAPDGDGHPGGAAPDGDGHSGGAAQPRPRRWLPLTFLGAFAALLALLPILARWAGGAVELFDVFYRTGSLVFGGGHVVLPLLQTQVVETGMVGADEFLAGYGAAQAVPGPLFTFAGYLGAANSGTPSGITGAVIALVAIFLPSALLILGVWPFWDRLRTNLRVRRALAGVNAAVVGLLGAAFYDPVLTQGITSLWALLIAGAAYLALALAKAPPWAVVIGAAALGWVFLG